MNFNIFSDILFAGLQLFLFIHTSESFLLLTANIADVKKLASKFVSESLADKIATFIAKAAEQVMPLETSEKQRDISEENKNYNIRQTISGELAADDQKAKKNRAKNHEKKFYFVQGDVMSQGKNEKMSAKKKKIHKKKKNKPIARTNSIENDNADRNINKTISHVIQMDSKSETNQKQDPGKEKKTKHYKRYEYNLMATSGNMILTRIITSKESNENHRSTKKN